MEIVETVDGEVAFDEVFPMGCCPSCGKHVVQWWAYCPHCAEPLEDDLDPVPSCEDVGKMGIFVCSLCGRTYVPVQLSPEGRVDAEWNACPGCRAVVA